MKYEDVQKLRTKYRQDPEVINLTYMRDVAVRCGNFKKAFEIQEKLEDKGTLYMSTKKNYIYVLL